MRLIIIFLVMSLVANVAFAQIDGVVYEWELKRDKSDIKIFTSPVEGSGFKAVRAEMLIPARLSSLVALVSDSKACPTWADLCKEEKVIEQVSPTESYRYTYNDIPFPVKDRDVLAHVIWTYDPDAKKVTMTSVATIDRLEKTKAVRIEKAVAQWHFTEKDDGQVLVENFAHIDPNGPTPAWITNLMLVDSPYKTLKNMRKIIASGKYDNSTVDFLP